MHELHPKFRMPDDENVIIWRYMSICKFKSLVERNALHFTKVTKFLDEGILSKFNDLQRENMYSTEKLQNKSQFQHFLQIIPYAILSMNEQYRDLLLINCWHFNEDVNDQMWRQYGDNGEGVAIKSTYKRLSDCFKNNNDDIIWIGQLDYNNIHDEWMDESNSFSPFLVKGNSYSYERELRAVTCLPDDHLGTPVLSDEDKKREKLSPTKKKIINENELTGEGKFVSVDLTILIDEIHLSPLSDGQF